MANINKNETELQKSLRIFNEPYKAGEHELKQYLRDKGIEVYDVSSEPEYWDQDIDILVGNEYETAIEIKWDSRINTTGNMFIENLNTSSKGNKGWLNFSKADYIAYGDSQARKFYIFSLGDLKKYIKEKGHNLRQVSTYTSAYYHTGTSVGYLLPIETFKSYAPVKEIAV